MIEYYDMNEKMPQNNIESAEDQEKRGEDHLAEYLASHPEMTREVEKVSYSEKHSEEIENLFSGFESESSLSELFAIATKEEVLESELRNNAKEALLLIFSYVKELNKGVVVPDEVMQKIEERKDRLSWAVGLINSGKVRHE